ncbi:MAG: type I restriction-modification system subunit M N-terminal domain-containing protein [Candidatus Methanoperedens sp.]|nr:type I restriction-modification system subunit M N-terminal domain-containing protein [Candidatus Methanoperedens sp.]CAG0980748.1 hypothetical protein METP1_01760 [Methanosarcinales archaeon]
MAKINNGNGKTINSQAAMDKAVKSVCYILRGDRAKGARLYVPELTWMFFLRYLDIMEENEEQKAKALGAYYSETLKAPYRWRDWAAPFDKTINWDEMIWKKLPGWKRCELSKKAIGSFLSFVNDELFPHMKDLGSATGASNKQSVMFHTKTAAYQQTKRKLLDECDLWCVMSLPQGVFVNAGAGVKTDLLFSRKESRQSGYYSFQENGLIN